MFIYYIGWSKNIIKNFYNVPEHTQHFDLSQ